MSRLIKKPVPVPDGVEVKIDGQQIHAKGSKGENSLQIHDAIQCSLQEQGIVFNYSDGDAKALAGTMHALTNNLVTGVAQGFTRKLELVGVGYRAQAKGKDKLNLQIGYSHPIDYQVISGVTVETPSTTEIVVKGIDKQKVGQVATEIRAFHPPEPYKGKGIRYAGEQIVRKEAKKK
ncbi:MAG: 50S ribosomal protein L6 [Chromatiales bacterium]|nr:50S ribosomal protein L6 [Chromatiales bacterium]